MDALITDFSETADTFRRSKCLKRPSKRILWRAVTSDCFDFVAPEAFKASSERSRWQK